MLEGVLGGDGILHCQQAFIPVAVDHLGLAQAAAQVSDRIVLRDIMVALGIPIPVWGLANFKRVAKFLLPIVSHFSMRCDFTVAAGSSEIRNTANIGGNRI
jgi:hypothetical protein